MEKQLEEKWEEFNRRFLEPVGDELIDILALKGNELVLDLASGTGEPGLSIAARVPQGRVILSDLSALTLQTAAERAGRRGLKNIETRVCDACMLPFESNTFDAISCRSGFMFLPDVLHAAKEMYRVLKPGGKIAVSVWNVAEKNPWMTTILQVIHMNKKLSDPAPSAPEIFRCAEDGYLINLFIQGGFRNIQIGTVNTKLVLPSAEVYWEMMTEVEPSVATALAKADSAQVSKIKYELYELLDQKFRGSTIQLASSALVLLAQKNN